MPSLSLEQTPELSQELQDKLDFELRIYAGIKAEFEDAKAALDASKGVLEQLRAESGLESVALDGGRVTFVPGGEQKTLDKKKLLSLGVTQKVIDLATRKTKKKGHTLVTLPGDKPEPARSSGKSYNDEEGE